MASCWLRPASPVGRGGDAGGAAPGRSWPPARQGRKACVSAATAAPVYHQHSHDLSGLSRTRLPSHRHSERLPGSGTGQALWGTWPQAQDDTVAALGYQAPTGAPVSRARPQHNRHCPHLLPPPAPPGPRPAALLCWTEGWPLLSLHPAAAAAAWHPRAAADGAAQAQAQGPGPAAAAGEPPAASAARARRALSVRLWRSCSLRAAESVCSFVNSSCATPAASMLFVPRWVAMLLVTDLGRAQAAQGKSRQVRQGARS